MGKDERLKVFDRIITKRKKKKNKGENKVFEFISFIIAIVLMILINKKETKYNQDSENTNNNITKPNEKKESKYGFKLYHFTDSRNIESIFEYGLLSWKEIERREIENISGSNKLSRNLDENKGLGDYVRLCKSNRHPMEIRAQAENRIIIPIWLEIDAEVIELPGTLFSNTNAAAKRAIINRNKTTALNSDDKQAEILIKNKIEPKYIRLTKFSKKQLER